MFPFFIHLLHLSDFWVWIGDSAVSVTAGLANIFKLPFAIEGSSILFSQGVADAFKAEGVWDGVLPWIGVSLFCILAFRRNLLCAVASLAITPVLWVAVRGTAWILLAMLSNSEPGWLVWSEPIAISVFIVGVCLVLAAHVLCASIFEPIPYELFNTESPLISYAWNWICGLPGIVLRVPKSHKIYLRWRTILKMAKVEPSLRTDYHWFRREFFIILFSPIAFIGGCIDAVRGWLYSRRWSRIWTTSIAFLIPAIVFIAFGFSFLQRSDEQVPLLASESEKLCSTAQLENANYEMQEPTFSQLMGPRSREAGKQTEPISDLTKRYIELLSKRILAIQPKNQPARYRLGLAYALSDQTDRATREMKELAEGSMPQAVEWLAKDFIIRQKTGEAVEFAQIVENVDRLVGWPQADYRLLRDYAKVLLELRGDNNKAIAVAKQAASLNPDLLLDLALMYARVGHPDTKSVADQAEAHYLTKINFPSEKESDRIAVAKARVLADRLDQAAEVLEEGLKRGVGGDTLRRELSNVQIRIYRKSLQVEEQGKSKADVALLEKAAETDPSNPNIATEIARMLPLGIDATDTLVNVLKQQQTSGAFNVDTYLLLGDAMFARGELSNAMLQWKAALDKDPTNVTAMNNYAYCLSVVKPIDLTRSLELLSKAHTLAPENADVLDTWGEVLLLAKRPREAINKLELSISYNKDAIETRKKLLQAYQEAGLEVDAKLLKAVIDKMEAEAKNAEP
jgi:tetratricopeptide (TPR) repeat protein